MSRIESPRYSREEVEGWRKWVIQKQYDSHKECERLTEIQRDNHIWYYVSMLTL